jgi:hypothetical protein
MKIIITTLLFIPLFCFSQKKDSTLNKNKVYGLIFLQLETQGGNPGGGLIVGYNFIKIMGLGVGAEAIPMKTMSGKNGSGIDLFGELRITAPSKKVTPSFAFQYGQFQYSDNYVKNSSTAYSSTLLKGKQSLGFNIVICINQKKPGHGFFIGYTLKKINFDISSTASVINVSGGQVYTGSSKVNSSISTNFNLISVGFKF